MRLFRRLGLFVENRHVLLIIIGVVLIVASVFGAMRLTMASGTETFISSDSQTYKDYARFNQNFSGDVVIVMVTGDVATQLLKTENLDAMKSIELQIGANQRVLSALSPASLIEQAQAQYPGVPIEVLVFDPESGQIRDEFKSVFPDDTHALISIALKGDLSSDEQKEAVTDVEGAVADAGFSTGVETAVTGTPVVFAQIQDLMMSSLRNMFIAAIALMLLILAFIFSVRGFFAWRWLPLGVVIIGVIYTLGAMGVLSVPITMVSMAVFPVLIGLGVDYAIQFHNRYDEEARRGKTVADAIVESVTHIGPAIGIAIIAACLGFGALFFSPVPMIRDFGLMLIIGVIACFLVALFLLPSILYWHDRRKAARANARESTNKAGTGKIGFVERGLQRLAPWVIKHPAIILPIALLATVGGLVADSHIETETDEAKFISSDVAVIKDLRTLEELAGGISTANVLVEAPDVTDPQVLNWMLEAEQRIRSEHSEIVTGTSSVADLVLQSTGGVMPQTSQEVKQILAQVPENIKRNLANDDYTAANLIVNIGEMDIDQMRELNEQLTNDIANHPEGVSVTLTGMSVIGTELFEALTSGRIEMTLIGVAFIFFGLLVLFRLNLFRAVAAALPICLIIGWSSGVMYLSGIKYTPLTATLGALILGIGTEFTILLMMRYYEEREKGEGPSEAMTTAMTKIGRAVIASGLTVIGCFAALLIAQDFPILRDFGIVTMVNVFFALVSTLVVLPTLIVLFDRWRERRRAGKQA
jgi:hydrophobe/amphiphile efflux-3 (HAE3) family protein